MDRSRLLLSLLIGAFVAAALAAIIYSSIGIHPLSVEVCITFKGRSACGTAAGETREQALRGASTVACSGISGGVTDTIACGNTPPDSVRWIDE